MEYMDFTTEERLAFERKYTFETKLSDLFYKKTVEKWSCLNFLHRAAHLPRSDRLRLFPIGVVFLELLLWRPPIQRTAVDEPL